MGCNWDEKSANFFYLSCTVHHSTEFFLLNHPFCKVNGVLVAQAEGYTNSINRSESDVSKEAFPPLQGVLRSKSFRVVCCYSAKTFQPHGW